MELKILNKETHNFKLQWKTRLINLHCLQLQWITLQQQANLRIVKKQYRNKCTGRDVFSPPLKWIKMQHSQQKTWCIPVCRLLAIHFLCHHFQLSFTTSYKSYLSLIGVVFALRLFFPARVHLFRTCHCHIRWSTQQLFITRLSGFLTTPVHFIVTAQYHCMIFSCLCK